MAKSETHVEFCPERSSRQSTECSSFTLSEPSVWGLWPPQTTKRFSEPLPTVHLVRPSHPMSSVSFSERLSCDIPESRLIISAMNRLQIPVLPSIVNAAVLVSIFSTTNSFVFAASRSLYGMAQRGQAPRILARTNKRGVPWVAVSLTLVVGCLAYLSVSQGSIKVLNWWINLVTAAQLVSWTCIAM